MTSSPRKDEEQPQAPLPQDALSAVGVEEAKVDLIFNDTRTQLDIIVYRVEIFRRGPVKRIIRETAERLEHEARLPIEKICAVIADRFSSWGFSDRYVRRVLSEKFKQPHRVKNAQKQKKPANSAAQEPLDEPETSGQVETIQVLIASTDDSEHLPMARVMTTSGDGRQGRLVVAATAGINMRGRQRIENVPQQMGGGTVTDPDGHCLTNVVMGWDEIPGLIKALENSLLGCSISFDQNGNLVKAEPDELEAVESLIRRNFAAIPL